MAYTGKCRVETEALLCEGCGEAIVEGLAAEVDGGVAMHAACIDWHVALEETIEAGQSDVLEWVWVEAADEPQEE